MSVTHGRVIFAIHNEATKSWWSVDGGWVDNPEPSCFFPSYDKAFEEMQELSFSSDYFVYEVEIPDIEYQYKRAHLPCNV